MRSGPRLTALLGRARAKKEAERLAEELACKVSEWDSAANPGAV